jgi:hypothetical protein
MAFSTYSLTKAVVLTLRNVRATEHAVLKVLLIILVIDIFQIQFATHPTSRETIFIFITECYISQNG